IGFQPILRAQRRSVFTEQRRFDAEYRVSLLFCEARDRSNEVRRQFPTDLFGAAADFFVKRAVAELQVVELNEVFDLFYLKWNPNRDADCADGKDFDDPLHSDRTMGADPFLWEQADHLRPIKEKMPRA